MDSTLALGALRIARDAGGEAVREREPRIPKPPGCSQGAQRAVFCAVRVADFLAEGAGWGASPGRGGELGCQAKKVIAALEFELKLLDQVEVSAVWIPHWHSEPFESQGARAAKRWT